jgi:hypothetical protein
MIKITTFFLIRILGVESKWVHSARRPWMAYCTWPRVIMMIKKLLEWRLAGETEVLGENLPQRQFVHHKSHLTPTRARTRATAALGSQRLTAWAMARPQIHDFQTYIHFINHIVWDLIRPWKILFLRIGLWQIRFFFFHEYNHARVFLQGNDKGHLKVMNVMKATNTNVNSFIFSVYGSAALSTFGLFSSFLIPYTLVRTLWTGDQPVARPLRTHRITETHNKRTQTAMPRVGYEPTNPVFERAKTIHALDRAATVMCPMLFMPQ